MSLIGLSGINQEGIGSTFTDVLDSVLKATPGIIKSTQPTPTYYGGASGQYMPTTQTSSNTGISTNTILLLAVAGLGIYFLTKKK